MDHSIQSVFDLQWPQDTNTAVSMHTPELHAIAYALDAAFWVKIIGHGGNPCNLSYTFLFLEYEQDGIKPE